MTCHVMSYNMHIHNIHTRIFFNAFSFSVVFSSSYVACRISLIALLLRDLQFNEIACYEINYEICNSTKQHILRDLQFNETTCYEINYEICNSTRQHILRDLQFNETAYYEICNSMKQRVTKST